MAGVDGAGTLEDSRRVYFILPRAPHGAMAERTVVPVTHLLPVPGDLEHLTVAAIALPGMSSWAALRERAHLEPGETVLVNGATGASGRWPSSERPGHARMAGPSTSRPESRKPGGLPRLRL